MSEEEEWSTPQSSSLEEASMELGIDPISEPEIGSTLTEVNALIRKSGLSGLGKDQTFNAIFSSIYHYNATSQAVSDSVWDVINRAFKVEVQSSRPTDSKVLVKATYLMCILMNETIKKANKKTNKDANLLEDRFSKWTKHVKYIMKEQRKAGIELDHSLAQQVGGMCWEAFKSTKKNKTIRSDIGLVLGGISGVVGNEEIAINLIKLIQKDESLGDYFADAIQEWTKTEQCRNIISALLHEMAHLTETNAQKGLVNLLEGLARRIPNEVVKSFSMLEELIASSDTKYWAREAGLVAIAEIYKNLELNGSPDKLDDQNQQMNMSQIDMDDSADEELGMKEKCFKKLTSHIYDKNSFARSFTLGLFKKLSLEVKLPGIGNFLERIVSRFEDNAALVRKNAVQCFVALLNQSPLLAPLQKIDELRKGVEALGGLETPSTNKTEAMMKDCLRDCEKLLELIQKASKSCLSLLKSTTQGDVVESIKYFYQIIVLGIKDGDLGGFRSMAVYVWSKEDTIQREILQAYKDIYLNNSRSGRTTALGLIMLIKDCTEAESDSIAKLIELIGIPQTATVEIWKFATGRSDGTLDDHQRAAALLLISYLTRNKNTNQLSEGNMELLTNLIDDETAGPLVLTELCGLFMMIRPSTKSLMEGGALEPDNIIFVKLEARIMEFIKKPTPALINLVLKQMALYFHICASPTELASNLIGCLFCASTKSYKKTGCSFSIQKTLFCAAFHAAGQFALHLAVFVECTLLPRITANLTKKNKPKNNQEDDMDDIFGNANDADETKEMYLEILEDEFKRGPFEKIVNIVTKLLTNASSLPEPVQNSAIVCLAKFMITSHRIAEEKCSLLFTILERSGLQSVVCTILASFPDLLVRHPNTMEPWTKFVFAKLNDESVEIRRSCLNMVTELIVKGLVKPRGKLADIAQLILDDDETIVSDVRAFFVQFGSEGNNLMNQLPDILANLHSRSMPESEFREISEFLFEQFQSKEKQIEQLVDKLCSRFKEDDPQIWTQVALTISVMAPSERSMKKMIENAHLFKEKLENLEIRDYLLAMPRKARENTKLYNKSKEVVEELEMILTGEKEPIHISPSQIKQHKPRTKAGPGKPGSKKGSSSKKANIWSSDEDDDPSDKENQESQSKKVTEPTPVRSSRSRRAKT